MLELTFGRFTGLLAFRPRRSGAEPRHVDGSLLGHVTMRPRTCGQSNMSEVAADNACRTPERRQQKLTARTRTKPWDGSLLKSSRHSLSWCGASAIWARAQFMGRGNIPRDPAVAD